MQNKGQGPFVIVVDDFRELRESLCLGLKAAGIPSVAATDARNAMALAREAPPGSVLLTDIEMPDMSGLLLAELTNRVRPDVSVVLMTGGPEPEIPSHRRGSWRLIRKPFHARELAASIRALTAGGGGLAA